MGGQKVTVQRPRVRSKEISKSEVSRRFVKAMEARMDEFFKRRIEDRYPIVMMDGLALGR
jgi:transposase-like protein